MKVEIYYFLIIIYPKKEMVLKIYCITIRIQEDIENSILQIRQFQYHRTAVFQLVGRHIHILTNIKFLIKKEQHMKLFIRVKMKKVEVKSIYHLMEIII